MTRTASRSTSARSAGGRRSHCSCEARAAATRESVRTALVAMCKCYADAVEIRELRGKPRGEIVPPHGTTNLPQAPPALARVHRERLVDRLRLSVHVERIDGQRPFAELFV